MSAHTPGPWGLRSTGSVGSKGGADEGIMVCMTYPCDDEGGSTDESRANARLIAAAPRMCDQLEKIAAFAFSDVEAKEGYRAALKAFCALKREARAILRDVEGESNG